MIEIRNYFSAFIFIMLMCSSADAQRFTGTADIPISNDFYKMQKEFNAYFKENPNDKGLKQWGRLESFLEPRVYPHGNIARYRRSTMAAQKRFFSHAINNTRSPHGNWGFMGPKSSTSGSFGRCLRAKFHPLDTNIIFVLASSGGLWKSIDNATTWENLTPDIPLLYAVDFVLDPNDPNTIYLMTGNERQSEMRNVFSQGILKTIDGGNTWSQTKYEFPSGTMPYKLVMYPDSSEIMYAATRAGIYRTENAWDTAFLVLTPLFNKEMRDIEFNPANPDIMYASSNNQVFRSFNGGVSGSWTVVTDPDFGGLDSMRRIELAITPANANSVYLVASDDQITYIMRSSNSGLNGSWTMMDDTTNFVGQSGYDLCINVDPTDANTVFVGAIGLWKSTAGGAGGSWTEKPSTHADHHDLVYSNGYLYDLNDGGVGRSNNNGNDPFTNITAGIEVFETYDIAGTPQDSNLMYAGGQDTGGNRIDPGGVFVRVIGSGDVTTCLQDPTDVDKSYMAAQFGGLRYTSDAWASSADTGPGGANFEPEFGQGIWLCPYELDPGNPDYIFTGKDSIWRLDMKAQTAQWLGVAGSGKTRAIVQGTNNRNRMYVIHGSNLFYTDSALTMASTGASWTSISNDSTVSALMRNITVNPDNANELYLVYSGNDAGNKVFYSGNSGLPGSWQNISGNLPNVPIIDIAFHKNGLNNHALYIGTDIGVFYRDDNIGDWIYFSQGMPSSPVIEIYINTTSNQIIAGTIGRGVWATNLYSNCTGTILLTGSNDTGGQRYYTAINKISSYRAYDPVFSTDIHYQAGDYVEMFPPFQVKTPGLFRARPGGCPQILDPH